MDGLRQELIHVGNVNFWPSLLAPLGKTVTDIEKDIEDLKNKLGGCEGEINHKGSKLFYRGIITQSFYLWKITYLWIVVD
jgi:hypothetical protein